MNSGAANIEEALSLTGFGKFHYLLTGCCALCLMAAGIQNGMNAFFLPAAQCDLNLTSAQIGSLNAFFLIGGICSAFLWGLLADLLGRKRILLITLFTDWVVMVFVSMAQNYLTLLILRYINGFLIGAPAILTYQYYGEFQPEKLRNKAVCFIGLFFNLFWLVLPAIAWLVIPLPWKFHVFGIWMTSWRIYIVILSIPTIISGIWMIFLPESPKFLLTRGESKEALLILNKMYATNKGDSTENFKVKLLIDNMNLKKTIKDTNDSLKTVGRGKFLRLLRDAKEQLSQLFKPPLLFCTILTSSIFFCNMFGYLGLGLWIPEILNKFEEHQDLYPNQTITLCEIQPETAVKNLRPVYTSNSTKYQIDTDDYLSCDKSIDEKVFINSFIMGACLVTANIVVSFFASYFNRKTLPIILMFLGSFSAASIYWLNTPLQHLIAGSFFQAAIGVGNIVLNGVIVDLFPTSVGAMAICTSILFGRLGAVIANLVLGFLLDTSCEIPILIIVIVLLIGTVLCFLIPTDDPINNEDKDPPKEIYNTVSDLSIISA